MTLLADAQRENPHYFIDMLSSLYIEYQAKPLSDKEVIYESTEAFLVIIRDEKVTDLHNIPNALLRTYTTWVARYLDPVKATLAQQ